MIKKIIDQGSADYIYTKFGQLKLPFTFAGKIIHNDPSTHGDHKDDYKWRIEKKQGVRGDVKLDPEGTGSCMAEVGDHLVLRQREGDTVYVKCVACTESGFAVSPDLEKALHGVFIENRCPADDETTEKLKQITGEV